MKKALLITVLALSYYTMQAQDGRIEFGLKGGFSVANMTDWGFRVYGYRAIPAFSAGALLNIKFNQRPGGFAIQPEVVFSRQGGVAPFPGPGNTGTYNYTTHLDYLNIPILMVFQSHTGFRFETGPQFGILLSATEHGYGLNNSSQQDRSNIYYPTDFGWVFGLGFVSQSGLGFDARFNAGWSNINSDHTSGQDSWMNNDVFQVGLFYQFFHNRYSRYNSHNSHNNSHYYN